MKYIFIIIGLALMTVGYQNCSGQNFSPKTDLNKALSLDEDSELIAEEVEEDIPSNSNNSSSNSSGPGTTTNNNSGSTNYNNDSTHKDNKDDAKTIGYNKKDDKSNEAPGSIVKENGKKKVCMGNGNKVNTNELVVCIVNGPGQSHQISFINDALVVSKSTPKTVCMSAYACLKIVDTKFDVKAVKSGLGYCKNGSADTIKLTDAQVKTLIDKIQ